MPLINAFAIYFIVRIVQKSFAIFMNDGMARRMQRRINLALVLIVFRVRSPRLHGNPCGAYLF